MAAYHRALLPVGGVLAAELLIIDDFALDTMDTTESRDMYERS
jgi:hypothetical protein